MIWRSRYAGTLERLPKQGFSVIRYWRSFSVSAPRTVSRITLIPYLCPQAFTQPIMILAASVTSAVSNSFRQLAQFPQ